MAEQTRKLSARAILSDMKAGLSDEELMKKHGLRPDQFARVYHKLVEAKLIKPGRNRSGPGTGARVSPDARPTPAAARASGPNDQGPEVSDSGDQSSSDHTEITRSLFGQKQAQLQQGVLFATIVKPGVSIYPESIGAAEGTVYFLTDDLGLNLWGIDLEQCEVKWRFEVGDWLESPVREHLGSLYLASAKRVYCVNGESGEARWTGDHEILPGSDLVVGDGVCMHLDQESRLAAVDLETGEQLWVSQVAEALPGSVLLMNGGAACVACRDGRLYGIDLTSGEEKWQFHVGDVTRPVCTVHGRVVYVANDEGYLYTLDTATGEVIWRFDSGYGIVAKPAVGADVVCLAGGDQALYGLDPTAGRQIWRFQLKAAPASSGLITKGMLCTWTIRGDLFALDLRNGQTKWTRLMGPKASADPLVSAGGLLVSEREILRSLNAVSGQENWRLELPERVDMSPLLSCGVFLVKVGQRMLYAVDARGPGENPDPRLLIRIEGDPQSKKELMRRNAQLARRAAATRADSESNSSDSRPQVRGKASSSLFLKIIAGIVGLIGLVLTFGWIRSWGSLTYTKIAFFACSGLAVMAAAAVFFWLANRLQRRQG